ncbi:MAG: hypothetical protein HKM01_06130 [Gallionella sp.]|jgi:hypothetical protein|nr:hypothetical protein [Gallionella sp.]
MFEGIIYFGVGVFFGLTVAYNHKDYRQEKTFEQVDEKVRNDLERYRNLSESLKEDIKFLKSRVSSLKQRDAKTNEPIG